MLAQRVAIAKPQNSTTHSPDQPRPWSFGRKLHLRKENAQCPKRPSAPNPQVVSRSVPRHLAPTDHGLRLSGRRMVIWQRGFGATMEHQHAARPQDTDVPLGAVGRREARRFLTRRPLRRGSVVGGAGHLILIAELRQSRVRWPIGEDFSRPSSSLKENQTKQGVLGNMGKLSACDSPPPWSPPAG